MSARRTEAGTFRAAPPGRRILAADGCPSTSSDPARCSYAVWAPGEPGSDGRLYGPTGLGMLICRIEGGAWTHAYALISMFTRGVES
jgi:hypothetical protein